MAYNELRRLWDDDATYAKFFHEKTSAAHIILTHSLMKSIEKAKQDLSTVPSAKRMESQKGQLQFLSSRGTIPSLAYAVATCMESIVSSAYSALLALQEMSQSLTADQREQARRTLESEYQDPRGVGITQDAGLPNLFKRTLSILEGKE